MSEAIDDFTFTWNDIEQWIKQGIIAPYQALAILQLAAEADSLVSAPTVLAPHRYSPAGASIPRISEEAPPECSGEL